MRSRSSLIFSRGYRLQQYAYVNRKGPTSSEARLWSALSGRRLGVQFRRQVVIADRYIVDFLAPRARLVVEVDGGYHAERHRGDARRDARLRALGYRIVRVEADVVMRDLDAAVAAVRAALRR